MTFGFRRIEILSAQANGVTLLVLAAFIAYEAIHRLFDPPVVRGWLILAVALVGVLVNLAAAWTLARANRDSLNVEGSFQHVVTDLYGFIGTALAAVVILATGFQRADPIASLLIAALMTRSGVSLVKASARVFMEAAPEGLDPNAIGAALVAEPAVVEVHDLHVWEITSGFPALSAHVLVGADSDCHAARREMEAMLHERFALDHTTLQVDHARAELLDIQPAGAPRTTLDTSRTTQEGAAMAKALYTAEAHVTGGRANGHGRSADGLLEVDLRLPAEMGGEGGGTNPEELFAVGYAACFEGALGTVARRDKQETGDVAIDSKVSLVTTEDRAFTIAVELDVSLPSIEDTSAAVELVRAAHKVCPYSNATRGNIEVKLTANGAAVD